jgi:hypothetical protein
MFQELFFLHHHLHLILHTLSIRCQH